MSPEPRSSAGFVGVVLESAYRIDALIGEGGMGAVYSATHLRLSKSVAVKVMARELAASTDALARFHREAQVTSALGHPHIVQVLDFSTAPTGEPFLVMEFLEGEDLDRRIRRVGRLSPEATVHVVKQVASALTATHAKGIVHRDLKPANVFLLEAAGETDFVKVLDFGISKVRTATTRLTASEMVIGTPHYMSPEQALGRIDEIDETTDQWALACIAWECLSGAGPFVGESVPSLLFQVVHESPQPLSPKVVGLAPQVEQVLRRALAKDKRDRFASVGAFCAAFEQAVNGQGGEGVATSPGSRMPTLLLPESEPVPWPVPDRSSTTFSRTAGEVEATVRVSRRSWRFWAVAAGGLLALLTAGFLVLRPGQKQERPAVRPSEPEQAVPAVEFVPPAAEVPPARLAVPETDPPRGKHLERGTRGEAEADPDSAPTREPAPLLREGNKTSQHKAPKAKKSRPKVDRTLIEEL